jgi:predicted dehydrogenase
MESRREFLGRSALSAATLAAAAAAPAGFAAPADSSKKIRIGVVGGGFGSQYHWHEHPNCTVAAVTDLRADRRQALQEVYRCDTVYASLEAMLREHKALDAVAVFSGAPSHYKHVEMCMNRGLHVISAVPATTSLEDAEKLRALKERTGLRYMMAETSYYRQPNIYARNLFNQRGFGELYYSELEYYHDRGDLDKLLTDKSTRFYEPDGSRLWRWGLPPMLYPTHCLGHLVGVTRERIKRVSCLGWGQQHPWLTENAYNNPHWCQSALMQTDEEHMVRCNIFWLSTADGERARWFGDKGSLHMAVNGLYGDSWLPRSHELDRDERVEPVDIPQYWKSEMLPEAMRHRSGHDGSHTFLAAEFINALVEDREPTVDVYEALAMTVPGIIANQSALKNGEQLEVPNFDRA